MVYGDLPESGMLGKMAALIDPSQIATAYFNAGLSAYSGNAVEESANAFKKARLAGYDQPECYIYEIACWQSIAQKDESKMKEAQANILNVAEAGHKKYGLAQPIFINNMINSIVTDGNIDKALEQLNAVIAENPDNANLYGLRGYVYDRAEKDAESEADYRKAASLPDVDFETLKNASKKIFRIGTMKWNELEGSSPETTAARKDIKENYFESSKRLHKEQNQCSRMIQISKMCLRVLIMPLETYFPN